MCGIGGVVFPTSSSRNGAGSNIALIHVERYCIIGGNRGAPPLSGITASEEIKVSGNRGQGGRNKQ